MKMSVTKAGRLPAAPGDAAERDPQIEGAASLGATDAVATDSSAVKSASRRRRVAQADRP